MSSDAPASWESRNLDELGFVGRGRSRHRPRNDPSLYGGQYPFFQTGDIKAAEFYLRDYEQTYNEKGLEQSKLWAPGTLCITIAANIAETAVLAVEGCFPDSVVGFIADPCKADARFVKYAIDLTKARMQNISRGTTQDNLSVDKLLSFRLPTPPLPVQRKIAAVLSAYDDLIENNNRRIAILEEMARSLYREWFVEFRFPGHERVSLADSAIGPIPEGWQPCRLRDVAEDRRDGVSPERVPGDTPYVGLEHIPRRSVALAEWGNASDVQSTKLRFKESDILFGKIRPYFHKVAIAPVNGVTSSDAIVIKAKRPEYRALVLATVSSDEFVAQATQTSQGTKMPRANWNVLLDYPTPLPPVPLLDRFNGFVEPAAAEIMNLVNRTRNLRHTRDLLLPMLVSGEIDVSGLEIDVGETAEA